MSRSGIVAAGLIAAAGCLDPFTAGPGRNVPVETPKLPEASVELAARVDRVGHDLLAATPFFPVEPTFHTAARPEVFVAHPDLNGVLVSEGLAKKCPTDAQLAAVLAAELGQMAAEKRAADRHRSAVAVAMTPDARGVAVELLTAAGFSASDLDAAGPLLAEAEANRKLTSGLGKKAPVPTWSP